jgi:tetratricopeptide (TPR) repeat protein
MTTTETIETGEREAAGAQELAMELWERYTGGDQMKTIFEISDEQLEALERQAFKFYTQGYYDRAETIITGVRALDDERPYPHLLLGDLLLRRDEISKAHEAFERADELRGDDRCTLAKLGETALRLGETERAREALSRVVELSDGDEEDRHAQRARVLLERMDA